MDLLYYLDRNRLLTLLALERLGTLALIIPCLVLAEIVLMGYFIAKGRGTAILQVWWFFLQPTTWSSIARHRREIRHLRVKTDAQIVRRFAGHIVFAELDSPMFRYLVNPLLWLYWALVKQLILW
jgi:hypothetical protein